MEETVSTVKSEVILQEPQVVFEGLGMLLENGESVLLEKGIVLLTEK